MTVLGTWDGDLGTYFDFSAEEFSNMVGHEKWDGQQYVIVQSGSNSWEGVISVMKGGNTAPIPSFMKSLLKGYRIAN